MSRHPRVTTEGLMIGQRMATLGDIGRAKLSAAGLSHPGVPCVRDDMCASCACRPGTVPNGCPQTQMDLLKCVVEGKPFYCHAPRDGRMCAGWVAARAAIASKPVPSGLVAAAAAWEFSPADEPQEQLP